MVEKDAHSVVFVSGRERCSLYLVSGRERCSFSCIDVGLQLHWTALVLAVLATPDGCSVVTCFCGMDPDKSYTHLVGSDA